MDMFQLKVETEKIRGQSKSENQNSSDHEPECYKDACSKTRRRGGAKVNRVQGRTEEWESVCAKLCIHSKKEHA